MLLSCIIAGAETNHGKGGFGNYSPVLMPLCSTSTSRNVELVSIALATALRMGVTVTEGCCAA